MAFEHYPDPDLTALLREEIAGLELYPKFVDVDTATLSGTPHDALIADAVTAGYSDEIIANALGIDVKLVKLHLWRLVAQGEIYERGAPEAPLADLITSDMHSAHLERMAALQANVAETPHDLPDTWLASAIAVLPVPKPKEKTEIGNDTILEAIYDWQVKHPYEQLSMRELGEQLGGMTRAGVSVRINKLREILSSQGMQLPRIFERDDEDMMQRVERVIEGMSPTEPADVEQLKHISRNFVSRAQAELFARGVVRNIKGLSNVRRSAVAVLRVTQSLGDEEIARVLGMESSLVTSDLRSLRFRDPGSSLFDLRDRPTLVETQDFEATIRSILTTSPDARRAEIARQIATTSGLAYDNDLYQRVSSVYSRIQQELNRD